MELGECFVEKKFCCEKGGADEVDCSMAAIHIKFFFIDEDLVASVQQMTYRV